MKTKYKINPFYINGLKQKPKVCCQHQDKKAFQCFLSTVDQRFNVGN